VSRPDPASGRAPRRQRRDARGPSDHSEAHDKEKNMTENNWPPANPALTPEQQAEIDRQNSPEHRAWVAEHRAEIDAAKAKIRVEDL